MKRLAALLFAAALGACAFWADRALFDENDAAQPIADGARFAWIENGAMQDRVSYRRVGAGYEVAPVGENDDPPMRVWFFTVNETPEEDYIAQVAMRQGESERFYAFMWRTAEGYRLIAGPRALEDAGGQEALSRRCSARPSGECRFDRADDVVALYREAVYPAFVLGDATPSDYVDQVEMALELEAQ